jgi:hypothetical protein
MDLRKKINIEILTLILLFLLGILAGMSITAGAYNDLQTQCNEALNQCWQNNENFLNIPINWS